MPKKLKLQYTGSGSDLLGKMVLGIILTMVTIGIYLPWYMNDMYRYLVEHTEAVEME